MNLAIIIGVEKYKSESFCDLPACVNEARVIADVLNNVKDVEETLLLIGNEQAYEIKRQISNFVEKYKGKSIDELFFYFSGHGDRAKEDFYYMLSDYHGSKKRSTGLKNSELDNWLKTLSPKLAIKIVDACYSGEQYIKSEGNPEGFLSKSAQKYGLKDICFWFSSRDNETSSAGKEFSEFTESILTAVTEFKEEVRYREIMDYVADDFSTKNSSKPIFITQSDNIEKFGVVTDKTHKLIFDAFGIDNSQSTSVSTSQKVEIDPADEKTFFEKIRIKSDQTCFTEDELVKFIEDFNENIKQWDKISDLYDIDIKLDLDSYDIPNNAKIGRWLEKNKSSAYFAKPLFETETYETEEYRALPSKPKSLSQLTRPSALFALYGEDDTEYKLETVTKSKNYINGFHYTHHMTNNITQIFFTPKIELVEAFSLFIVPIYSNKDFTIHFSYEKRQRNNWSDYASPLCKSWRILGVEVKSKGSAETASQYIKSAVEEWLKESLSKYID